MPTASDSATNLSTDGIYILADDDRKAIDGEESLAIEFTLPTGRVVHTTGRVIRVDDERGRRGLGIAFVDLDDADRLAIETFIASLGFHGQAASA